MDPVLDIDLIYTDIYSPIDPIFVLLVKILRTLENLQWDKNLAVAILYFWNGLLFYSIYIHVRTQPAPSHLLAAARALTLPTHLSPRRARLIPPSPDTLRGPRPSPTHLSPRPARPIPPRPDPLRAPWCTPRARFTASPMRSSTRSHALNGAASTRCKRGII